MIKALLSVYFHAYPEGFDSWAFFKIQHYIHG